MNAKEAREKMAEKRPLLVKKQIDFITQKIKDDVLDKNSSVQVSSFNLGLVYQETIDHFKNEGYNVECKDMIRIKISWN